MSAIGLFATFSRSCGGFPHGIVQAQLGRKHNKASTGQDQKDAVEMAPNLQTSVPCRGQTFLRWFTFLNQSKLRKSNQCPLTPISLKYNSLRIIHSFLKFLKHFCAPHIHLQNRRTCLGNDRDIRSFFQTFVHKDSCWARKMFGSEAWLASAVAAPVLR